MPRPPLHVVQISFFNDPEGRSPAQLLEAWPTLVDVAEAVTHSAIRVSIVQASVHSEYLERQGVRYCFLPFGRAPPGTYRNTALGDLLSNLAPDVIHVHGLSFPDDVLSLAALVPRVPFVLQDHADRPPRLWRRAVWRRAMSTAAGIAFCALDQARPFADARVLHPGTRLYEIPESTTRFTPGDRDEARRATGLTGDPALLWVGHLNSNKDPLTVLRGVSAAARRLPGLQLFCCFGSGPLLRAVQDRVASDPDLRNRVHLLGRVDHGNIEQLMRAADLFVLGSHHEGSGYSLIEALACGLPPVVTDIPSFRSLTGAAPVGVLWPCGNPQAFCQALCTMASRRGPEMRAEVRAHFERELSFPALGAKLAVMYDDVQRRARGAATPIMRAEENSALRTF
jgi:glycosyltransferase involved in cell wall biosynthesis